IRALVTMRLGLKEELALCAHRPNHGEMVMRERHVQNRRLAHRRVSAHGHRQQVKAGFIYEEEGASFLLGLFFSAVHCSRCHCAIAPSSRWRARTMGFCTLCPIRRSNRLTWAR